MFIVGILASTFLPTLAKNKVNLALVDKAVAEIKARLDASRWYFNDHDAWPSSASNLKSPPNDKYGNPVQPYLPAGASETSVFGSQYQFSSNNNMFTLTLTGIPAELVNPVASQVPNAVITGGQIATSIPKPGLEAMLDRLRTEFKEAIANLDIHDFEFSGILDPNSTLNKPACKTGQDPYIFITPVMMRAGTSGYPIIGVTGYNAVDNGSSWTVGGIVKGQDGVDYETGSDIKLLTYVICF